MAAKIGIGGTTPSPPADWVPITSGELELSNSAVTGNSTAVNLQDEQSFDASDTDFSDNTNWGLVLLGTSSVNNCTIDGNTTGGVWMKDIDMTELTVSNLTLAGNGQYGLYAEDCDLTFDATNMSDWTISGSQYAIVGDGSNLTFNSVTISGGSVAAVRSYQGTMTADQTTFSGSGYGLAAEESNGTLDNCTFSGNTIGLYANQNSNLLVRGSTITDNSLWGATVYASGVAGETTTFENCVIHNNAGGLSIVNATSGEVLLTSGTIMRDNTETGLHFSNCNLTVSDQAGGSACSTLRNKHGISSSGSTLTLSGVAVEESTSYAIHSTSSALTLSNCNLTGRDGVYAVGNSSTTVNATRISSTSSVVTNKGLHRVGGSLVVRNSVITGFQTGMYLATSDSTTATIQNATIANATSGGIHVDSGGTQIVNTIVAGSGGQYGIRDSGGNLTHSYNIVHGFSTLYFGTTAATTEIPKNPQFANASDGDFHLSKGSPAINAGSDLSAQVPVDLDGVSRPMYDVFEIGAYEFSSANGSIRVLNWNEKK